MVFVKTENDCIMAAKWIFRQQKKTAQENAARNKTEQEKHSEYIKGIRLKICRRAKNYGAIRQAG